MDIRKQTTADLLREWERRKAFVGFTDEAARLLQELGPIAATYADDVVEDLYRQLLQIDIFRAGGYPI